MTVDNISIKIVRTGSDEAHFGALTELLDAYLYECYGEAHDFFNQFNTLDDIKHVAVAYIGNVAVGCGAFKKYDNDCFEIKRLFVKGEYRRKGIGECILNELETWASEFDFNTAILETGWSQPESIALYRKAGYNITENYGQYEGVELSVCMKKSLSINA